MASPPLQQTTALTTADDIIGAPAHACALPGQFSIDPSHASLVGMLNASARPSFARRVCLLTHSEERSCALNV